VTAPQSQCDRILETLALGKGGHDWSTAPDQSDRDRFMAKVRVDENGCWRWTAGHNRKGYGCFGMKRQNMGAHRAAYMLFVGPIPEGLDDRSPLPRARLRQPRAPRSRDARHQRSARDDWHVPARTPDALQPRP
jgi:hypothetical protein